MGLVGFPIGERQLFVFRNMRTSILPAAMPRVKVIDMIFNSDILYEMNIAYRTCHTRYYIDPIFPDRHES